MLVGGLWLHRYTRNKVGRSRTYSGNTRSSGLCSVEPELAMNAVEEPCVTGQRESLRRTALDVSSSTAHIRNPSVVNHFAAIATDRQDPDRLRHHTKVGSAVCHRAVSLCLAVTSPADWHPRCAFDHTMPNTRLSGLHHGGQ